MWSSKIQQSLLRYCRSFRLIDIYIHRLDISLAALFSGMHVSMQSPYSHGVTTDLNDRTSMVQRSFHTPNHS